MKLTIKDPNGNIEIPASGKVFHNGKEQFWVRYNDVIVWKSDTSENTPMNLTASKGQVNLITISWVAPENITPEYYNLYRDGSLYKSNITDTFYNDEGLAEGDRHEYYATSVYLSGTDMIESNPSNTDEGYTKSNSGSETFTEDGVFTVPKGITKIKLCMISGGNAGSARADDNVNSSFKSAGGKAGQLVEKIIDVFPDQQIAVQVGKGGIRTNTFDARGGQGYPTIFGDPTKEEAVIAYPSDNVYHYGEGNVTGTSGCDLISYQDGFKKNCIIAGSQSGSKTFTSNYTWTVPNTVTSIKLCMIGGGGGGAFSMTSHNLDAGGGWSGQVISRNLSVKPNSKYKITIGQGGLGGRGGYTVPTAGHAGTNTSFGTIIAVGGKGGELKKDWCGFGGNGESRSGCWGTTRNGYMNDAGSGYYWGGQAGFGNGGDTYGGKGGIGAGGGAGINGVNGGDGGRGEVRVSWSGEAQISTPYSYGGQGTIFGKGGDGGYSGMTGCENEGIQAQDGEGYGAGGGGTYLNKNYSTGHTRVSGAGKQGVCIVAWGTEITGELNSNESSINVKSLSDILGYDILENNFLNTRRYSTKTFEESAEFISKDFDIKKMNQVEPEGFEKILTPENE